MEKLLILGGIGLGLWWFFSSPATTPAVDANGQPVKALPPAVSPVSGTAATTGVTVLTQPVTISGGGEPVFGPPPPLLDHPLNVPVGPGLLTTGDPIREEPEPFYHGPVMHSPYTQ